MKESPKPQLNFFWIATSFILLVGVLISLHWPEITNWRTSNIDSLLQKAQNQTNDEARYIYLQQAHLLGSNDALATQAMAEFWLDRGDIQKVISTYQNHINSPNYIYLGNLALQAQSYQQAQGYFARASKDSKTSASLIGEATALYDLDKVGEGCEKATQASKLDLSSQPAKNAITNCITLGGTNSEAAQLAGTKPASEREAAYLLIDSKAYKPGEEKLVAVTEKSITDYLVLARLAAARADTKLAAERAEQGIGLDKSNYDLNVALVQYYQILGNDQKEVLYQNRLNELNIVRSIK